MCLPTEIPAAIDVDVSALLIHHSIKIKDVAATYPNVEFLDDEDTMLATVIPPTVEAAPVVAVDAAATAEPELIRKPGAEGEGEEAAAGGKEEKKKEDKK
jgi:large subunit ribosomal protein L25